MSRVVIFGACGFLGSYVVEEAFSRGYGVIAVDLNSGLFLPEGVQFIQADICDANTLKGILASGDIVYNFAGLSDIDEAFHEPKQAMELNVLGNINILNAACEVNVKRFMYASSAYAVSNKGGFYGISKLTSEKLIEEYYRRYALDFTVIRYGSLYGERADRRNGVYRLLEQALLNGKIEYSGDGSECREYIHAKDAARLSLDLLSATFSGKHVMLTGVEKYKQSDFLDMLREIISQNIEVTYLNELENAHYKYTPYSFTPSTATKLTANPYIDFGQGIVSCLEHMSAKFECELHEDY